MRMRRSLPGCASEWSNSATGQLEGNVGRALSGPAVRIRLFQKMDREAVFAAADFGKAMPVSGQKYPNQLMGGCAIQSALKESVYSNFGMWCGTFANQLENQGNGIAHGSEGGQPSLQMFDAKQVIRLEPMVKRGYVELTRTAGYVAPLVNSTKEVGLSNRFPHQAIHPMDSWD